MHLLRKPPSQLGLQSSAMSQSSDNAHKPSKLHDLRIRDYLPLSPPHEIAASIPVSAKGQATIKQARLDIESIIRGDDDRVLCIVGPCSIHDVDAGIEYARMLSSLRQELAGELYIVMRTYFEKPRTTIGWKGLLYDPFLDGSCHINTGIQIARQLLSDIVDMDLPVGCELLDPISPQFLGDLISWGAIGARTTESQIHRQLASGVSFPVGFKNGTSGDLAIAMDAMVSSSYPHQFLGVTHEGLAAITQTTGNEYGHVILRGAGDGVNYDMDSIISTQSQLRTRSLREFVIVDCSHGNSQKDYRNQPLVLDDLCETLLKGVHVGGIMVESNLVAGKQALEKEMDRSKLVYGQSVTDGCVDFAATEVMLRKLAAAVNERRRQSAEASK